MTEILEKNAVAILVLLGTVAAMLFSFGYFALLGFEYFSVISFQEHLIFSAAGLLIDGFSWAFFT